jgi:hypothetical protein
MKEGSQLGENLADSLQLCVPSPSFLPSVTCRIVRQWLLTYIQCINDTALNTNYSCLHIMKATLCTLIT